MRITGSLVVCSAAALFTAGALLLNEGPKTAEPYNASSSAQAQIDIQGFAFSAAHVVPGGTVVVANRDAVEHTVSASNGAFVTGAVPAGHTVSFNAPTAPGTYQFVCAIHPSMKGQLVVG
jgi:plastocyanin